MAEDRKPRQILDARIEGKRGRGRPRKVWMDDIKEAAGRKGKTIQEAVHGNDKEGLQKMDRGPDAERQKGK
jgi:hypothetical protein